MKSRILFDACPLCEGRTIKTLRSADCSKHPLYNPIIPPIMNWLRCAGAAETLRIGQDRHGHEGTSGGAEAGAGIPRAPGGP